MNLSKGTKDHISNNCQVKEGRGMVSVGLLRVSHDIYFNVEGFEKRVL